MPSITPPRIVRSEISIDFSPSFCFVLASKQISNLRQIVQAVQLPWLAWLQVGFGSGSE
jgi:hypothetical protein